jgi:geranylgeranyl pyrophosphate synthase
MTDPVEKLADEQLLLIAADLQVQLERKTAMRPVLFFLAEARTRAAKAILILALDTDPEDVVKIRKLQAEIAIYDDMITSARKLMAMRKEALARIKESDRDAIDEMIVDMSDDERRLNGFEPRGKD